YNLYKKFWALQDFFINPNQLYPKYTEKYFQHMLQVCSTHELKPDQVNWVKATIEQVNIWKNKECPPFKRPTPDSSADIEELLRKPKRPRHRTGDVIRDAHTVGKYHMRKLKQTQSDIKLETEETPEVNDQEFNKDVMKQENEVENTGTKGRKLTKVTPDGEIIRNSEKPTKFDYTSEEKFTEALAVLKS
ncbi:hypothetical protein WN51_01131, partial [Melipona quadrifasciata]